MSTKLSSFLVLVIIFHQSCIILADSGIVGTASFGGSGIASWYRPPYSPTACYGNERSQFPTGDLFAAAGEEIWSNGDACGRHYIVRCIKPAASCKLDGSIRVKIIDRAKTLVSQPSVKGTTMVLSQKAFGIIGNLKASGTIGIEWKQVSDKHNKSAIWRR